MSVSIFALELLAIIHAARARTRWSVLLVPEALYETTLKTISALSDFPVSGRTIIWPDLGRKFSIVSPSTKVFARDFDLFVIGWESSTKGESEGLTAWKSAAREFVSSSEAQFSVFETHAFPRAASAPPPA